MKAMLQTYPVIRTQPSWPLKIEPLPASLLLIVTALGSFLVACFLWLTLVPLVMILGGMAIAIVTTLLLGWAGIEALAAFERWVEQDPRFQR